MWLSTEGDYMKGIQVNETKKALSFIRGLDTSYSESIGHFTKYLEVNNLSIEPESIQAYYEALNSSNYSANTIKIRRAGCKYAIQELLDNSSNMFNIEAQLKMQQIFRILEKKVKAPKLQDKIVKNEMIVSKDEYKKLRQECTSNSVKSFMAFLWNTGCRVGEMVSIKLSDCRTVGDKIFITVMGKGQKERSFPVSESVYKEARTIFQGTTYLFEHTGKPYTTRYISKRFKVISNRIIGRTCNPHSFRHSFITNMVIAKIPAKAISEHVGHSASEITNRYTHVTASIEDIEKALLIEDLI